jgi:hypothetical protein
VTLRQTFRTLLLRIQAFLSRPVPTALHINWFWFVWQVCFVACVLYLSVHLPSPGISIGVLGLLAVVATFERDPSSLQRCIWIIAATGLFWIEIYAIANDRLESQAEQAEARAIDQLRFFKTAKALQTAIKEEEIQTKQEQKEFNETTSRFEDVVNTETGGNSFCYLSFVEAYGGQYFHLKAVRVGKYPLKGVWAIIIDSAKGDKIVQAWPKSTSPRSVEEASKLFAAEEEASRTPVNIGDFATDDRDLAPYPLIRSNSEFQQYIISLGANNGNWVEEISMKLEPGPYLEDPHSGNHHWSQALVVHGPRNEVLLMKIDPDYPRTSDGIPINLSLPPGQIKKHP